jgi:hypothetical protein
VIAQKRPDLFVGELRLYDHVLDPAAVGAHRIAKGVDDVGDSGHLRATRSTGDLLRPGDPAAGAAHRAGCGPLGLNDERLHGTLVCGIGGFVDPDDGSAVCCGGIHQPGHKPPLLIGLEGLGHQLAVVEYGGGGHRNSAEAVVELDSRPREGEERIKGVAVG